MKYLYSLILFVLLCTAAAAQKINYQKTFQDALAKAAETNKPVFVAILPPVKAEEKVSEPFLNSTDVADLYNKTFVSYAVRVDDTLSKAIIARYHVENRYPCYLFLDSNGGLVNKQIGNFPAASFYTSFANTAVDRIKSGNTLSNFDDRYNSGKVDARFLQQYITMRESLGYYDNAKLINEYVDYLPVKSLQEYQTVLFILKAGPIYNSKAYALAYVNRNLVDSIYKREPLALRQSINGHIIKNSMDEAIKAKNLTLAMQVADFSRTAWAKDYKAGYKAYNTHILNYYKSVGDTAHYYQQAQFIYDEYMRITADSIKRQKELNDAKTAEVQKRVAANKLAQSNSDISGKNLVSVFIAAVACDCAPQALNNAAYDFYKLGTHNPLYLNKAIAWSKRSIVLEPNNYAFYDTLAHLLYRMEFFEEAAYDQEKAVKLAAAKASKMEMAKLKAELTKIKQRQL